MNQKNRRPVSLSISSEEVKATEDAMRAMSPLPSFEEAGNFSELSNAMPRTGDVDTKEGINKLEWIKKRTRELTVSVVQVRKDIPRLSNDKAESTPTHEEDRRKRPSGSEPEKVKKKKQKLPEAEIDNEMNKTGKSPSKEAKSSNPANTSTSTASSSTQDTVDLSGSELEIVAEFLVKRVQHHDVTYGPPLLDLANEKPMNEALVEGGNAKPKGYSLPIKSQQPQLTNMKMLNGNVREPQSLSKETFPEAGASAKEKQTKISTKGNKDHGQESAKNVLVPKPSNPPASTSSKTRESISGEEEREEGFEYVAQCEEILVRVTENDYYKPLINHKDRGVVLNFLRLFDREKALLLHFLETKHKWMRVSDIDYPQIAVELSNEIDELLNAGFLKKDTGVTDLRETLHLLKVKEVDGLLNAFNLTKAKKKADNIEVLLKYCERQSSIQADLVRNARIRLALGECVKVNVASAKVLTRLSILESLPRCFEDNYLSEILLRASLVKSGALEYLPFEINVQRNIFNDRVSFLEFHEAYLLFRGIEIERAAKNFTAVAELAKKAFNAFKALFEPNKEAARAFDKTLPEYLRRFSAGHTLALAMTRGLDAVVKLKEFGCVLEMLEALLGQDLYCSKHRGSWYETKANVCSKAMMRQEVYETIFKGIDDAKVDMNAKVALASRAASLRIARLTSHQMKEKLEAYASSVQLSDPPCFVIKRERAEVAAGLAMDLLAGETAPGSLETCVLNHYIKNEGFAKGRPIGGSIIISLFATLFWEEIYDDSVADVFISKYQLAPLDLYGKEFYEKRQAQLERKMKIIEKWSFEESKAHFARTWRMSEDKVCLVDTEAFSNAAEAHGLFECIGAKAANKIFLKLMKDFDRSRDGFPNLVFWSPGRRDENKYCYKFVTVKKPLDSLPTDQRVWNDFLLSMGIPVEVCKVNDEKLLAKST